MSALADLRGFAPNRPRSAGRPRASLIPAGDVRFRGEAGHRERPAPCPPMTEPTADIGRAAITLVSRLQSVRRRVQLR